MKNLVARTEAAIYSLYYRNPSFKMVFVCNKQQRRLHFAKFASRDAGCTSGFHLEAVNLTEIM